MRTMLLLGVFLLSLPSLQGATVTQRRDPDTGWVIYSVISGDIHLEMSPAAGCNVFSLRYKDTEFLRQSRILLELLDGNFGIPVIYPSPGVVRNSTFAFDGQVYRFRPTAGPHFFGGLVRSALWQRPTITQDADAATMSFELHFQPGTGIYKFFSIQHILRLTLTVRADRIRWTYEIDNSRGMRQVPFGFAIAPVLNYQGRRPNTYLIVPADSLMEMQKQLPTGKLLPLTGTKSDARTPIALTDFVVDNVYAGRKPEVPAALDFRDNRVGIWLRGSPEFTYFSVYAPPGQEYFSIESATAAPDAHNLFGQSRASGLIVVEPGQTWTGWVEMQFQAY